jgi:hypothetical protein
MIKTEIDLVRQCCAAYEFAEEYRNVARNPGLWVAITSVPILLVVRHIALEKIAGSLRMPFLNPCLAEDKMLERLHKTIKQGDTKAAIRYLEEKLRLLPLRLEIAHSWKPQDVHIRNVSTAKWEAERDLRAAIQAIKDG